MTIAEIGAPATFGSPYWWDEAPPASGDAAHLPAKVDVVVIGAGYTGLSAALTLARRGRSVLVCESHLIGHGASSRNGGHVGAKLRPKLTTLISRLGEPLAVQLCREAITARANIARFIQEERIACDFVETPRFTGAHKPSDFAGLAKAAEIQRAKLGLNVEVISKRDQSKIIDTPAYHGGVLDHSTGAFHPAKFVQGLARLAQLAGASIATGAPVHFIARDKRDFTIETARGTVTATNVIVATNGYSASVLPQFRRRIIPIGSYMIATEALSPNLVGHLMPGTRLVGDTRFSASFMHLAPGGNRILYGGRVAATEIDPDQSGPRLKAVLNQIFPDLRSSRISHSWMGFTGFTFDDIPHIGELEGMHYAMGYCGTSGTSLGVYLGNKIALRLLGSPDGDTAFDKSDFQTRPYYAGTPWFLSAAVAYYRLRDRLKI